MSPAQTVRIRAAAIIVQDERVLLVKHAKDGRAYWLLPGGGVDFGESLSEALVRELEEETQLDIRPGALVLVNDSIAPDGERHVVNLCFTADIVGGTLGVGEDPRVVGVEFVPIEDLSGLTLYPAFNQELATACRENFPHRAEYLGNLWE